MEHKTRKNRFKPKILRTVHYEHAYLTVMVVLIPLILQTVINLRMQSITLTQME